MKHIRVLALALALGSIVMGPLPARAGGMWDPNESGHRLDMRWVGVYFEADGRFRVTVTFYDRVRVRWFAQRDQFTLSVDFQATPNSGSFFYVTFFRSHYRLWAQLCEAGSSCGPITRAVRPNAITVRAWARPVYGPFLGWSFRGSSNRRDRSVIDRTAWGVVT
jgi:hypothetical protein